MFPYLNTVKGFLEDTANYKDSRTPFLIKLEKGVDGIIDVQKKEIRPGEKSAWQESEQGAMSHIIEGAGLADDIVVGVEVFSEAAKIGERGIASDTRPDFVLAGKNKDGVDTIIVIELKRWNQLRKSASGELLYSKSQKTAGDKHPTKQIADAVSDLYKLYEKENEVKKEIRILPCVYMHCCEKQENDKNSEGKKLDCVRNYKETKGYTDKVVTAKGEIEIKTFFKDDVDDLKAWIKEELCGNGKSTSGRDVIAGFKEHFHAVNMCLYKEGINNLNALSKGDFVFCKKAPEQLFIDKSIGEFTLREDQAYVLTEVIKEINGIGSYENSKAVVVTGGPGSGKTLIALILQRYCELINKTCYYGYTRYAMDNSYHNKSATSRRDYVNRAFDNKEAVYDVVVCDEANGNANSRTKEHRLPLKKMQNNSKLSIFLFDGKQKLSDNDFDESELKECIVKIFGKNNVRDDLRLTSQFRCGQNDGYLAWVEHILGMDEKENQLEQGFKWYFDFDVKIVPNPADAKTIERIIQLEKSSGREFRFLGRGINQDVLGVGVIRFLEGLGLTLNDVEKARSVQGLEFDSCFVLLGKDIHYEKETGKVKASEYDKNFYRVMLTRGMKKCYIYCYDKNLEEHLRTSLSDDMKPLWDSET